MTSKIYKPEVTTRVRVTYGNEKIPQLVRKKGSIIRENPYINAATK